MILYCRLYLNISYSNSFVRFDRICMAIHSCILPRVNNREEESVEHMFGPSIIWSESNVTIAKAHVMYS